MLIPKLRFKEFTDEWIKKDLNKISSKLIYGMNCSATDYDGTNKYIRITDINEGTSLYNNSNLVSPLGSLENKYLVHDNDILFARTGASTGKSYLYNSMDGKLYFAGFLIKAHINAEHNSRFIFEQLKLNKYKNWVKLMSIRSGQSGINANEYGSYILSITSKNEENKIAKTFELLNKKIELQTKKIEVLKLYKLYTSQKVLINTNNFDNCKLANILYPGNKISVNDTSKYEKITIKLNFKGLEKSNVKREMCDTRPFYIRDENEIIIGKQNYFNGSIAKVSKEFSGCICSNAIMSFKVIDDVNVNYVLYYLSQKKYIKQRAFLANGTGQKELSEKDFLNFEILIPNRDRQDQIANFCNLFIKKIEIEENKLCKLNELKKGFMQNMFV